MLSYPCYFLLAIFLILKSPVAGQNSANLISGLANERPLPQMVTREETAKSVLYWTVV